MRLKIALCSLTYSLQLVILQSDNSYIRRQRSLHTRTLAMSIYIYIQVQRYYIRLPVASVVHKKQVQLLKENVSCKVDGEVDSAANTGHRAHRRLLQVLREFVLQAVQ